MTHIAADSHGCALGLQPRCMCSRSCRVGAMAPRPSTLLRLAAAPAAVLLYSLSAACCSRGMCRFVVDSIVKKAQ